MRRLIIISVISFYYLFCVKTIFAQVLINEVYPQPTNGQLEWVEIKNSASQAANLSGWYIEDILTTPKTIFTFGLTELNPGDFFVATFSGQLNNGADGVVLKDFSGQVISQMKYESSLQDQSWSFNGIDTYTLGSPTKGAENVVISPSPLPSPSPSISPSPSSASSSPIGQTSTSSTELIKKLQLIRVGVCPKEGAEWLEWLNPTSENILATIIVKDLQANNLSLSLELNAGQSLKTNLARHIYNNGGDELFVYFGDQLLINKNLPNCESLDTVFTFDQDSSWPIVETILDFSTGALEKPSPSPVKDKSMGEIKVNKNLSKLNFKLPSFDKAEVASESSFSTDDQVEQVLGATSPVKSGFVAHWFLIGGGFLWIGVGIIEIYGFVITQNKVME